MRWHTACMPISSVRFIGLHRCTVHSLTCGGFFIRSLGFRPYVKPFLYRLQFVFLEKLDLFQVPSPLFINVREVYFFARNASFRTLPKIS